MAARTKNCVVAYLDILGYVEGVQEAISGHRSEPFLLQLREAFDDALAALRMVEDASHKTIDVKTFSDNIIFAIEIEGDAEAELLEMVRGVGAFQAQLVLRGFFVRGAIAIGQHYMDSEIIYGEAILEAYTEESNRALNPRVMLASSAYSNVQHHLEQYEGGGVDAPQTTELLIDADGKYFVNYLASLCSRPACPPSEAHMRSHCAAIERALRRYVERPSIWTKYVWVAQFHNGCCIRWTSTPAVDENLINAGPRPLPSRVH